MVNIGNKIHTVLSFIISPSNKDTIKLLSINRNNYYKYKKELSHELQEKQND